MIKYFTLIRNSTSEALSFNDEVPKDLGLSIDGVDGFGLSRAGDGEVRNLSDNGDVLTLSDEGEEEYVRLLEDSFTIDGEVLDAVRVGASVVGLLSEVRFEELVRLLTVYCVLR